MQTWSLPAQTETEHDLNGFCPAESELRARSTLGTKKGPVDSVTTSQPRLSLQEVSIYTSTDTLLGCAWNWKNCFGRVSTAAAAAAVPFLSASWHFKGKSYYLCG